MLLGRLQSGERVVRADRTILSRPGLEDLVRASLARIESRGRPRIIKEINFHRIIGLTPFVRTTTEDIIVYARRKGIKFPTRFVKNRDPEPTRFFTVFLRRYESEPVYWVDTAFIGTGKGVIEPNEDDHLAPKGAERDRAKLYWSRHAWVWEPEKITPGSETTVCPW